MKKNYFLFMFGTLLLIFGFTQRISAQQTFVHPGIPFTQSDLNQLKVNITQEPWLTGYNALRNSSNAKLTYAMQGPFATVTRAPDLNNNAWKTDMVAVHNLTFMFVFTGDSAYAAKATQILDAWAVANTTWGGGENMLDIGDYAPYFITAADILKSTYSGWTATNTTNVNNYFVNVLYPASWVPNPLRDHNKGAIQLQIALGIAAFLDDEVKWNQAIEVYRMDAGGGFRNSLSNGEVGDTGRDDHWFGQIWALSWDAEVAFKQGVDMFAELNNRILAMGELYNQYAINPSGLTYIPFGGYSTYWTYGWGIPTGARHQHPFNNVIQGAYSVRKGIATPYTSQMRTLVGESAWSFLYLKSSDASTATPMTPIVYPSENAVPATYFSNMDIGNPGLIGSATYGSGNWTVKGSGTSVANSNNFTFKPVKGDAAIVVKIENNSLSNATSGLMIRESLSTTSNYVTINLTSTSGINSSALGQTAQTSGIHTQPKAPWWLKLERVGNRVFTYHSPDGVTWTNNALYIMTLPTDTYIGFYTVSNNTTALNTATFSNVAVNNTFAVGSPVINSTTSAGATLGTAFNFAVTATGSPTTFAATGLPAGLSINATTGIISGTPTTVGKSAVLLQATNVSGTGKSVLVINVISNLAPVAVNNLAVSSTNSIIKLTWSATANATSYNVKRSLTSGGPYTTIQTGISGTSYIDPTPAYEVNNYYVVTALVGTNESAISNQASGAIPPAIPSNLVATNQNGQVNLTWSAADGASTYKIKRATTSGGPYTQIAAVSTTSYSDTAVTNGTAYYYVVTSQGNTLESSASSEVFGNPGTNSATWSATPTSAVFNLASNWTENSVPTNPAILTFKTSEATSLTNNITGLVASRILFDVDALDYTINGNGITLKSDLINNSTQSETLTMPIVLDGQLNVSAKTNSIALSGIVSGTGSLLKTGTSALIMSGNNTYSGNTIIRGTTGYAWGSTDGIQVMGTGTGTSDAPTSGPLGTGKIILEGGALYTGFDTTAATLYNDIEVVAGKTGYFYERQGNLNIYGKLLGGGSFINDGSDNFASIKLYGNNSGFTGTFVSKLRSGQQRVGFMVPEAGSPNAKWLLDAASSDCHQIVFASGTLEFGELTGRGGFRADVAGTPVIKIGALNTDCSFSGFFADISAASLSLEKTGVKTLILTGNSSHKGATTILNGTLLLNNDGSTGAFSSRIIANAGAFGGTGKCINTVTIGTGSGTGAAFVPGTDGTVGTFTTTGLATLKADATYKVDVNSTAITCDKVIANGITLNNPTLVLNDIGSGTIPTGTTFTILNNTASSAVSGTFNNLPEMSSVTLGRYSFNITYVGGDGNDVQLLNSNVIGQTYYKFDEQSGTQATDTWGTNPGTLQATATRNTGRSGSALKLDGTSTSYASLPTGIVSTLNDFTISSWVKMDALANWMRVFDFGTGTSKYMFLSVQTGSAGSVRFAIKNGGSEQGMTYNFAIPLNIWTLFSITQSGNTCSMYINGTLVATNTGVTIKPSTIGSTNLNYLGKSQWNDPMFNGSIDEFKIFNRALTAAEIAASYLSQTITLNPTAQKVMGDADFGPAIASSGLAVTYTSSNESVASIVNGKVHILATGTSTITASQAGNDVYAPAQSQTQVLTVVKKDQTINFAAIGTKLLGDADFDPSATASSGLSVTYNSSNASVASIVNGKVHILGTGTSTITASQAGDNIFSPAQSQTQVLTVVITNNTAPTAVMGTTFTYTITNNTALNSFTATGLPAGLSLNTTTGVISGTPTEYGTFSVALAASNGSISGTQTITLTVYTIVNNVIVASGDAKNIIEWNPIQNFSYNVKRSTTSGGAYTTIGTVTATSFTDTNVSNGSTYYYVVSTTNTLGENPNSAEVTATPNTGQITYLKFDESSGTSGIDSWGAKHATLQATATRDVGYSGSALKLNGTSTSYATLPTGIVSTLNDFTISSWVKMDALANWMRVFDFGTGITKYIFLSVQTGSAGSVRFAIKNGGTEQGMSYNFAIPLNTWTHFAITQSGNTCSMYINGALVATNTGVTIKPSTIGSTNQNYLGKSQWNDPMFKGSIDGFKIYSRALSATEINTEQNITSRLSPKKGDNFLNKDTVIKNSLIYPNPVVNNTFTVATNTELVGKEVQVKLTDLTGQTIYLKSVKNDTGTIDVVLSQALPDGIYILILNNQYSGKVIIKK